MVSASPNNTWSRSVRALLTALLLTATVAVVTAEAAQATNPIIMDRFVADPSAHVFNGRMYIYATDDQSNSGTYWDSSVWRAYSSNNLTTWTDHGSFFGIAGGFAWANELAWAPTAAYRNGYYYFYAPVNRDKIGVARSTSPTSGFRDVRGNPLIDKARDANTGAEPIDPAVFTDADGQAYMYFGTRTPKVVKLGADMMSTTGGIQNVVVDGGGPSYGEAPWLHKYNGLYYFSYSTGWPGQIAYATGTSPMGPFTYRGIILDYTNISTNHQSIVEYQGQWYIVYHRNGRTGGGNYKRSLAMEYLYHNADGTIRPVAQTANGVGPVGGTTYATFTARHSGKVAEVPGSSTANGTALAQYTRTGGTNQQWQVTDAGGGYYTLVNRASGKCADVSGRSTADGAAVLQYTCGTGTNQQWQLRDLGTGYLHLVARHSGKCLDVTTASTADGAALIQWTCGTGANQQWTRAAA